jgi:hypothetical protein
MEINIYVYINTCPEIFIAALFTTAPNWKQSACSSKVERINK